MKTNNLKKCSEFEKRKKLVKTVFDWRGLGVGILVGYGCGLVAEIVGILVAGIVAVLAACFGFGLVAGLEGKKIYEDSNIDVEEKE